MVTIDQIKQLREETGVSVSEVKKALEEAKGDMKKAKEILRTWGKTLVGKKASRETRAGVIDSYLHPNTKTGVLLDVRCESDFVAKSLFVSENEIPEEFLDGETKIYKEQIKDSGKPEKIVAQILEGKLSKYKAGISLLSQPWIKDDTKTIKNLIEESVAKIGENIEVKRFARYEI